MNENKKTLKKTPTGYVVVGDVDAVRHDGRRSAEQPGRKIGRAHV